MNQFRLFSLQIRCCIFHIERAGRSHILPTVKLIMGNHIIQRGKKKKRTRWRCKQEESSIFCLKEKTCWHLWIRFIAILIQTIIKCQCHSLKSHKIYKILMKTISCRAEMYSPKYKYRYIGQMKTDESKILKNCAQHLLRISGPQSLGLPKKLQQNDMMRVIY